MNLPLIKMIALDLDGTTLQSNHAISKRTRTAIHSLIQKGVHISVCTGRPVRHTHEIVEALGLQSRAILYNGAVVYDYVAKNILSCDTLTADLAAQVIERIQTRYPSASASMERTDGWFWDEKRYHYQRPVNQPTGVGNIIDFVSDNIIKLLFKDFTGEHDIEEMAQALTDLPVYVTWSSESLLEVMAADAHKGTALEAWAQELSIPQQQTMAFGDQDNDKTMLQWAGFGVAMANAPQSIQSIADHVTLSNNNEGVAVVLEQLIAEHYS